MRFSVCDTRQLSKAWVSPRFGKKNAIVRRANIRRTHGTANESSFAEMPPLPNETNARPVHTEAVQFEGRQTRSRSLALAQERQRIAAEEAAAAAKQQRKKRPV